MHEMKRSRNSVFRILFVLVLALCITASPIAMTFAPGTGLAYGGDEDTTLITGSFTIAEAGTYELVAALANATITIATADPVTILGNGIGDAATVIANSNISITGQSDGIDLTLENVSINNNVSNANVIDFTGGENTLTITGVNLLEGLGNGGSTKAMVRVAPDASLDVSGSGTLYFYSQGQGAGFGSNAAEKAGDLSFSAVTIFGKTTQPGPAIGSGASYSGPQGNIVFNSGEYTLIGNSMAAAIGGGAGSGGGALATPGGNVRINGGTFNINVDFSGAAIGGGGYRGGNDANGGNLIVTGGSIRTYLDTNAVNSWSGQGATAPGVTPIVITAEKINVDGEPVYLLPFDTTPVSGTSPFAVYIDDELFYNGGSHHYRFANEDLDRDQETRPITTTLSNWIELSDEPNLYFYVTGEDHTISVNGVNFTATWNEATSTFTVTQGNSDNGGGEQVGAPGSGDLDGDGIVTVFEAVILARYITGLETLTPAQIAAVDMDGDGELTIMDAVLLLRKSVGL
ncbi:MAG: dockerin type I repeat-containing protein [Clostridiales Family XIII bacterium]|nr:dockerin type I repeat-containing protein [Clostridiales Family XIII bacterium]